MNILLYNISIVIKIYAIFVHNMVNIYHNNVHNVDIPYINKTRNTNNNTNMYNFYENNPIEKQNKIKKVYAFLQNITSGEKYEASNNQNVTTKQTNSCKTPSNNNNELVSYGSMTPY